MSLIFFLKYSEICNIFFARVKHFALKDILKKKKKSHIPVKLLRLLEVYFTLEMCEHACIY